MKKHQKNGLLAFIFTILLSLNAGAVFASNPFFRTFQNHIGVTRAFNGR